MSFEINPDNPDVLTAHQSALLDCFANAYTPNPATPQETALFDQTTTDMRETITSVYGQSIATKKEFYAVMAGVSAATDKMEMILGMGLPASLASRMIRQSLAGLIPLESDK